MGQSSDPMEKYSELKTGMPTTEQSESQKFVPEVFTSATVPVGNEFADLKLQGTNEVNNANFLEGKEGVLYFKMTAKSQKITEFKMEIADFPISSRPTIIPTTLLNVHGLKWTPPLGVIPNGKTSESFKLKLRTTSTAATDLNLKGMTREDVITVTVVKDNSIPTIIGKTKLENGIDEGQSIPFTVDIEDKASANSPNIPEIRISSYIYSNTEAFRVDGARYVTLDYSKTANPARIGTSKTAWRFFYILKVDELPLDRDRRGIENPLSPAVDVCFHIMVDSVIGTKSIKEQVCFKGRYAAQLPLIQWENDALKEIKAGAPTVIKFKAVAGNGLGQVSIKNMAQQISGLTGKKDLICSPESATNLSLQNCELTWAPTCVKAPLTKKLSLKIDSVTGKKSKSETFVKEFTVIPSEENCPAPVAKTPAKPAVKAEVPAAKVETPKSKIPAKPTPVTAQQATETGAQ
tara:strand:+ start:26534 stop:27922 length:1389 start_codon:yes stop_codon:yes gene_type:complete